MLRLQQSYIVLNDSHIQRVCGVCCVCAFVHNILEVCTSTLCHQAECHPTEQLQRSGEDQIEYQTEHMSTDYHEGIYHLGHCFR